MRLSEGVERHVGGALEPVPGWVVGGAVDAVEAVRVAAPGGPVRATPVGEQAMEGDHRARFDFKRYRVGRVGRWKRLVAELIEDSAIGRRWIVEAIALEQLPERTAMCSRNGPETAVVDGGIFERKPESDDAERIGPQECGVLMHTDLATNPRLLEDVHRLQRPWVAHSEIAGDRTEVRVVCKLAELVVGVVLSVADLVDR